MKTQCYFALAVLMAATSARAESFAQLCQRSDLTPATRATVNAIVEDLGLPLDACADAEVTLAMRRRLTLDARAQDLSVIATLPFLEHLAIQDRKLSRLDELPASEKLTTLSLSSTHLAELTGVEHFPALLTLSVYENRRGPISDLTPIASLARLRDLRLSFQSVTTTSGLGGKSSLHSVDLSNNALSSLDGLEGDENLQRLDVSHNVIGELPRSFETLKALVQFSAGNNRLYSARVLAELPSLREVDLSHNQLVDLAGLADVGPLRTLDVSDNYCLAHLDPLVGKPLARLVMRNTAVKSLAPLKGNRDLEELVGTGELDASELAPLTRPHQSSVGKTVTLKIVE